jgi:hypothetical protein
MMNTPWIKQIRSGLMVLMQGLLPMLILAVDVIDREQTALSLPTAPVTIDPRDSICYIEVTSGRVLDLSQICSAEANRPVSLVSLDRRFMNDYQAALNQRYRQLPAAQTALAQSQQNPQAVLQRARNACARIQNGMLPELALLNEGKADSSIVNQLALNHYCPDLDD